MEDTKLRTIVQTLFPNSLMDQLGAYTAMTPWINCLIDLTSASSPNHNTTSAMEHAKLQTDAGDRTVTEEHVQTSRLTICFCQTCKHRFVTAARAVTYLSPPSVSRRDSPSQKTLNTLLESTNAGFGRNDSSSREPTAEERSENLVELKYSLRDLRRQRLCVQGQLWTSSRTRIGSMYNVDEKTLERAPIGDIVYANDEGLTAALLYRDREIRELEERISKEEEILQALPKVPKRAQNKNRSNKRVSASKAESVRVAAEARKASLRPRSAARVDAQPSLLGTKAPTKTKKKPLDVTGRKLAKTTDETSANDATGATGTKTTGETSTNDATGATNAKTTGETSTNDATGATDANPHETLQPTQTLTLPHENEALPVTQDHNRLTTAGKQNKSPPYHEMERHFLIQLHIDHPGKPDWTLFSRLFNLRFQDKLLPGSDLPRPNRTDGSLRSYCSREKIRAVAERAAESSRGLEEGRKRTSDDDEDTAPSAKRQREE
ncbi:hypothetical protein LTR28_007201 [Elasticomyces elasticus]|nr:hypothetical protein LTR28_007201 [Elasticomyces elasticus]